MTTIRFNSKGQRIEELYHPPLEKVEPNIIPHLETLAPPLEKVEPNVNNNLALSSSRRVPFSKVDKVDNLAPPFLKVDKVDVDEQETLAWCEYYLNSKKKDVKLTHIYFSK